MNIIKKITRISSKDIQYRIVYKLVLEFKDKTSVETEIILETDVFGKREAKLDSNLDDKIQETLKSEIKELIREGKL